MRRVALLALVLSAAAAVVHADSVRVGERAPTFTLTDLRSADTVSLEALRGHVVCLDFWATWCATCKAALPELDALARRPGFEDVRFVAVNIDRDRKLAERFLAELRPTGALTMLYDGEGAVLARYGASGMPALYLIDRDGVVRHLESGYQTAALKRVEQTLDALVAPRP